jgi:peptide/nickel transport system substrate-binding protein
VVALKPKTPTIVFQNLKDDTQGVAGVAIGDFNVFQPVSTSLSMQQQAATQPSVDYQLVPGLQFEHFDFNLANSDLAKVKVRLALANGTDRKAIIAATVGQVVPSTKPLGNRMFVPSQAGYVNNGSAYDDVDVATAKSLLTQAGYHFNNSDGYFHKGSSTGDILAFDMYSTTAAIRGQTMQLWQNQMKNIGVKINIHQQPAGKLFGETLPGGNFDIAEFAWVASVAPSANQAIYCSYTDTTNCGSNYDNYANPATDALLFKGATEPTDAAEAADYNAADRILWNDMPTLPLYQKPVFVAYTSGMSGVLANPTSAGVTWNAQDWKL